MLLLVFDDDSCSRFRGRVDDLFSFLFIKRNAFISFRFLCSLEMKTMFVCLYLIVKSLKWLSMWTTFKRSILEPMNVIWTCSSQITFKLGFLSSRKLGTVILSWQYWHFIEIVANQLVQPETQNSMPKIIEATFTACKHCMARLLHIFWLDDLNVVENKIHILSSWDCVVILATIHIDFNFPDCRMHICTKDKWWGSS